MSPNSLSISNVLYANRTRLFMIMCIMMCLALLPSMAFAQQTACTTVTTFAGTVKTLLNAISIVVVTIAVIFAGYQIAFAHKRIGDVAPVLIGAVLIGAASQIATMFLNTGNMGNVAC